MGSVIAVPNPDGAIRIAGTGDDGTIRLSPPVDDLLTSVPAPLRHPTVARGADNQITAPRF